MHQIGKQHVGCHGIARLAEMDMVGHRQRWILAQPFVDGARSTHRCRPIPERPALPYGDPPLDGANLGELGRRGPDATPAINGSVGMASGISRALGWTSIAVGWADDQDRRAARLLG